MCFTIKLKGPESTGLLVPIFLMCYPIPSNYLFFVVFISWARMITHSLIQLHAVHGTWRLSTASTIAWAEPLPWSYSEIPVYQRLVHEKSLGLLCVVAIRFINYIQRIDRLNTNHIRQPVFLDCNYGIQRNYFLPLNHKCLWYGPWRHLVVLNCIGLLA